MNLSKLWIVFAIVALAIPAAIVAVAQDGSATATGPNPLKAECEGGACGSCTGGACAQEAQAAPAQAAEGCCGGCAEKAAEKAAAAEGCCGGCEQEAQAAPAQAAEGCCGGCAEKAAAAEGCCGGCEQEAQAAAAGECCGEGECAGKCEGGECAEKAAGECGGCCAGETVDNGAGTLFVAIDGMCCNGCVGKVTDAIKAIGAVTEVSIDRANGRAVIHRACAATCSVEKVLAAVKEAGYEAECIPAACRVVFIEAMTCGGCAATVTETLGQTAGVLAVTIDRAAKEATVVFDTRATNATALLEALATGTENKFTGAIVCEKVQLTVEGMTCNGCSGAVQAALEGIDGVNTVVIDRESKAAVVMVAKGTATIDALIAAIKGAGFEAAQADNE